MTAVTDRTEAPAAGNPWRPSWHGVALVARIEMLRRRPTRKGYVFYGIVLGLIALLSLLAATQQGPDKSSVPLELILVMVLGVGYLVGPSLAATAINGDSQDGVLAPMQMTRLTAGDLAFGKLLASWGVTLVALATTLPFLWFAFGRAGWSAAELFTVLGVILLLVLIATAMGLAWSSIANRNAVSVALTHVTTGFFVLGTVIVYAFSTPLVTEDVQITDQQWDWSSVTAEEQNDPAFDPATLPCTSYSYTTGWQHTDRISWMLLINPIVVIGETSPIVNPETWREDGRAAPGVFANLHQTLADARLGQDKPTPWDWCADPINGGHQQDEWQARRELTATYARQPWVGLAFNAALGAVSMLVTVRRLRVPYRRLGVGTRVA